MTEFEIKHGLSQCPPGPLEPVELAQQDDTLARTGNTACDQEMYAAGLEKGEENAKHNAAIRGAWLPIESAPQTGRTLLLGYWNSLGKWRTVRGQWMSLDHIAENWEEPDDAEAGWFETAVEAEEAPNCWRITPSHWQPLPAAPGTPASPVSTVEQGDDDQVTTILWTIMRDAQAAKEPCGEDPESAAAIRNSKLASIAGAAAQALGLVKGPEYPAPAAGDARDAARYRALIWVCTQGFDTLEVVCKAAGVHEDISPERLEAIADAAIAAQPQGGA